jgi:hypothetical protein
MRRSIVLICIVICLIALWLMRTAFQPEPKPDLASKPAEKPSTDISATTAPKAEKPPAARKPLQITSKGKIRLKPGESAVLGYWEILPA